METLEAPLPPCAGLLLLLNLGEGLRSHRHGFARPAWDSWSCRWDFVTFNTPAGHRNFHSHDRLCTSLCHETPIMKNHIAVEEEAVHTRSIENIRSHGISP
jgi:hypothetical protein